MTKDHGAVSGASPSLCLEGRNLLDLSGVEDILTFDDACLEVQTSVGRLTVDGEELHIEDLSLENKTLTLSGRVDALSYDLPGHGKKTGLFGRKS